jgi:hypothetical protein
MSTLIHTPLGIAALSGLLMAGSPAQALPAVQTSGHVEYMSGGIGQPEAEAIEHASKQWPLTIEFAEAHKPRAEFVADVETTIRDAKGHAVLQVEAGGPFLLAKLAPGPYTVDATLSGKTLHKHVTVARGQAAKAVFLWPAGTGESRA